MQILAVDIGGTRIKIGCCSPLGVVSGFQEYATESHKGGPYIMEQLLLKLAEYEHFDVIAVSTAGQVDAEKGIIVYANENIPEYTGMQVGAILGQRFKVPVKVENDVNAAALGELHFGAARPYDNFLCLTFGTGVGGAIVINRRIYRGADGVAAEFGHMFTHSLLEHNGQDGAPYYESFASTSALVRNARRTDPDCTDGRALFDRIHQGDRRFVAMLDSWTTEVSAGLASLIHIFNPAAVIIGGGIMEQESLVRQVEARTKSLIMPSFSRAAVIQAELGNKAGILGAAALYLQ
ncbi:Beta-glucoside kinase [compost metagenome]